MRGGPMGGVGLIGVLVAVGLAWLLGADPRQILQLFTETRVGEQGPAPRTPGGSMDPQAEFVSVVLAPTPRTPGRSSSPSREGATRRRGAVQSACGFNSAAVGPFYCPPDQKVYIDLGFFRELDRRFGAPGDFAQAYVVAHEVGHHVQDLLGIAEKVSAVQSRATEADANALSVRMELQADCLAGVWAHHAHEQRKILEEGDVEEGLNAAAAIGDDTLQRRSQGHVAPESWTHGSSQQRVSWFTRGLKSGQVEGCDTFKG
jgi:predicted metalloprotease